MIEAKLALAHAGFSLDIDLALPARGVSALFGPSGCGKTMTLRALAGLVRARGRVCLDGACWQDDARGIFVPTHRRGVGYVMQDSALFPHLSVSGNLGYARRRAATGDSAASLDQAVDLLGIGPLLARRPEGLSGGERQRVAIARALAGNPRLLLMDEPMAALDARRKAELLPYLERLQGELSIPIVYVSHSMDEVARLADHLVLMQAGRERASGPLGELLARPELALPLGEEPGVVLDGCIGERDTRWQLARIDVGRSADGGVAFWARDGGLACGTRVRLRVLARDVSLAREPQSHTSIANQLAGSVDAIAADTHPALALVGVRVGTTPLIARVSRRSAHHLALAPGVQVWVQVKTVALME